MFQGDNNMEPDDFFANFWESLFTPAEGKNGGLDYDDESEPFGKLYNWFDLIQIQFRVQNAQQRISHKEKETFVFGPLSNAEILSRYWERCV